VRPERVRRVGTQVIGIEARTTRQREAAPATARGPGGHGRGRRPGRRVPGVAARGPMPDALAAAWERIAEFFERAPVRRAWTADLEVHYPTGSAVDVLVALRPDGD
jgi:hypothetical protein